MLSSRLYYRIGKIQHLQKNVHLLKLDRTSRFRIKNIFDFHNYLRGCRNSEIAVAVTSLYTNTTPFNASLRKTLKRS